MKSCQQKKHERAQRDKHSSPRAGSENNKRTNHTTRTIVQTTICEDVGEQIILRPSVKKRIGLTKQPYMGKKGLNLPDDEYETLSVYYWRAMSNVDPQVVKRLPIQHMVIVYKMAFVGHRLMFRNKYTNAGVLRKGFSKSVYRPSSNVAMQFYALILKFFEVYIPPYPLPDNPRHMVQQSKYIKTLIRQLTRVAPAKEIKIVERVEEVTSCLADVGAEVKTRPQEKKGNSRSRRNVRRLSLQNTHIVVSQLNGANGECTGSDDLDNNLPRPHRRPRPDVTCGVCQNVIEFRPPGIIAGTCDPLGVIAPVHRYRAKICSMNRHFVCECCVFGMVRADMSGRMRGHIRCPECREESPINPWMLPNILQPPPLYLASVIQWRGQHYRDHPRPPRPMVANLPGPVAAPVVAPPVLMAPVDPVHAALEEEIELAIPDAVAPIVAIAEPVDLQNPLHAAGLPVILPGDPIVAQIEPILLPNPVVNVNNNRAAYQLPHLIPRGVNPMLVAHRVAQQVVPAISAFAANYTHRPQPPIPMVHVDPDGTPIPIMRPICISAPVSLRSFMIHCLIGFVVCASLTLGYLTNRVTLDCLGSFIILFLTTTLWDAGCYGSNQRKQALCYQTGMLIFSWFLDTHSTVPIDGELGYNYTNPLVAPATQQLRGKFSSEGDPNVLLSLHFTHVYLAPIYQDVFQHVLTKRGGVNNALQLPSWIMGDILLAYPGRNTLFMHNTAKFAYQQILALRIDEEQITSSRGTRVFGSLSF